MGYKFFRVFTVFKSCTSSLVVTQVKLLLNNICIILCMDVDVTT